LFSGSLILEIGDDLKPIPQVFELQSKLSEKLTLAIYSKSHLKRRFSNFPGEQSLISAAFADILY